MDPRPPWLTRAHPVLLPTMIMMSAFIVVIAVWLVPTWITDEARRFLGIGFYTGIGVPEGAWVPPLASPETGPGSEDDGDDR